jgi:hypothetical protein
VIRLGGFSPVTVALLAGAIWVAVGGLRGLGVYGSAVIAARVLSSALVAVLADVEEPDRPWCDAGELAVLLPRGVQAVATCLSIAVLDGVIQTVGGILGVPIYAGCVLLGWAVPKAATPAIAWLIDRLCCLDEQPAMDGRGVGEARIREWNDAWTRTLEHLERERRVRPSAG